MGEEPLGRVDEVGWVAEVLPELISREAERVARRFSRVKGEVLRIREELLRRSSPPRLRRVGEASLRLCAVAVDTSFTSPPIELTGGKLGIVFRAAVSFGTCRSTRVMDHSALVKFIEGEESRVSVISKIVERSYVLEMLRRKEEGVEDFDLVIIDGDLVPRIPPGLIVRASGEGGLPSLYRGLIELSAKVFKLAAKTGTSLAGVLKRTYGRDIPVLLGVLDLKVSDKALATYMLKQGEWIDLGNYELVIMSLRRAASSCSGCGEGVKQRLRWLRNISSYIKAVPEVELAIYKPVTPTYFSIATKTEVMLAGGISKEDLVTFLATITSQNGVPYPVDVVDRLSGIRREVMLVAQQQLYLNLAKLLGDEVLAMSIAGLTNPEKMWSIGFRR
ncbi:MAG: hypothetical protein B6U73_05100 [Desulfurococcales archaeon ex4484_204]|nr:MAG: hypothetical protein B6U73_05100 [Desulfurococcales archaeon ex4484_204]